jgi:signal transduction histidine kinase
MTSARQPPESLPKPAAPPPFFDRRRLRAMHVPPRRRGLLAGLRIRKKLALVHTVFSVLLAVFLLALLRPAASEIVRRAEANQSRAMLQIVGPSLRGAADLPTPTGTTMLRGAAGQVGLSAADAEAAMRRPGEVMDAGTSLGPAAVMAIPGEQGRFVVLAVVLPEARAAITRLYLIVGMGLLAVYALVIVALEVFVLPQSVYEPIRRMYAADLAVADGRQAEEMIPEQVIPADELGDIMRSRNQTVRRLREKEAALADALLRLEAVATDLKRKNHLLETAKRNLADADRLASLGMMSAGIAHELNTPLAVLKGLVEELERDPRRGIEPERAGLMLRVVRRLERLSEGLLDFARVRPPTSRPVAMRTVVAEAMTLVRLDRDAGRIEMVNGVSESLVAECDADRFVQVLVNLIRNAVDAIGSAGSGAGKVTVEGSAVHRDGQEWVSLTVTDTGPGIDAAVLPRLFEPFASTRLDSRGTGLGLAVAEGIVREHGGVILARNRTGSPGAALEIVLPARAGAALPT